MAGLQRIRGQEVTVQVYVDSVPQLALTDIRSFTVTPKFTKLEEQYLGETTKRYDEIFDGVDFEMELHMEDPGVFAFLNTVKQRAQTRTDKTQINIAATLQFANGVAPTVNLINCFFENMPVGFGSRSDYGTFKISGSCSDITV